ncbi:uncharacterized protein LOC108807819 [Raphanus sativus]|uniref:Uncharacterized protein LOC108807819 n=1 Tax=Raphanus sativus TaxID=3726 RepID=A0A6J0JIU6_RAPSA|nr:uncharacterized protein LOC108807819 [Raphanus sativus]
MEIIMKAISDAKEWQNAQAQDVILQQRPSSNHVPSSAPSVHEAPPHTVICNVDAAWDVRTANCGIGAIFSGVNTCLNLSPCSDSRSHISSALMAEALAIRFAVMYAASSNVKVLMILSDSLSMVKPSIVWNCV